MVSPDRIAQLVEAAKKGELPEPGSESTRRRGPRLRTVDFNRPTKFNSDQQRRLVRAIETFCQATVTRLSSELRAPVELEVLNTLQLTWLSAQAQLPAESLSVVIEIEPGGGPLLLCAEQPFVLSCLECLLGGGLERPPQPRRLTEIDQSLTGSLFQSIVSQLALAFKELGSRSLRVGELDTPDAGQLVSVSEATLVVLVEARILKHSFSWALLIPWMAVEPLLVSSTRSGEEDEAKRQAMAAIQEVLSEVPVVLRAEVADTEMAMAEILSLAPGSIVKFDARAEDGVALFAENVKVAGALPGASGPRRAVQVRSDQLGAGA